MMKRAQLFSGLLIIVLAIGIYGCSVGHFAFDSSETTATTEFRDQDFIWIWCTDPGPWDQRGSEIEFAPDHTYTFLSKMEGEDKRLVSLNGTWEIVDGNILRIAVSSRTHIVGGVLIEDHPYAGSYYKGGETITTQIDPINVTDYSVEELEPVYTKDGRQQRLKEITVEHLRFYKSIDEDF